MAGQRYKMRGINDDGDTANFVETDQILIYRGFQMSVTVIRGSVPCFWGQQGLSAELTFSRTIEMDAVAFQTHLQEMFKLYGKLVWINLLDNRKKHELALINRFESLIKMY